MESKAKYNLSTLSEFLKCVTQEHNHQANMKYETSEQESKQVLLSLTHLTYQLLDLIGTEEAEKIV